MMTMRTTPCSDCGKQMAGARGSLPASARRCHPCRRAMPSNAVRLARPNPRGTLYQVARAIGIPAGHASEWRLVIYRALAERDGASCGICSTPVDLSIPSGPKGDASGMGPSVDHVVQHAHGGSDDLSNLRLTHWSCNLRRGRHEIVALPVAA